MSEHEVSDNESDHDLPIQATSTHPAGRASSVPPARQGRWEPVANPDDPPVQRPPRGPYGPLPGPRELGAPGRIAIVQGQVFLVAVILIVQLWLVTDALLTLLSGHPQALGWLTLTSGVGLLIVLLVWLWPRRRTIGR